jgi:hypothetical protein
MGSPRTEQREPSATRAIPKILIESGCFKFSENMPPIRVDF